MNYIQKSGISYPSIANIRVGHPFDSRAAVDTVADLYKASTWFDNDNKCYIYDGMIVSIKNEKQTITLPSGDTIQLPLVYVLQNVGDNVNGILVNRVVDNEIVETAPIVPVDIAEANNWLNTDNWRKIEFTSENLSSVELLNGKFGWYVEDLNLLINPQPVSGQSNYNYKLILLGGTPASGEEQEIVPEKGYYWANDGVSTNYNNIIIQDATGKMPWHEGYVLTFAQELPIMKYVIKDSFGNEVNTLLVDVSNAYVHKPFSFIASNDTGDTEMISSTQGNAGFMNIKGTGSIVVNSEAARENSNISGGMMSIGLRWKRLTPEPAHMRIRYDLSKLKPVSELAQLANIAVFGQPITEGAYGGLNKFVLGREYDVDVKSSNQTVDYSPVSYKENIEINSIGSIDFPNTIGIFKSATAIFSSLPDIVVGKNSISQYPQYNAVPGYRVTQNYVDNNSQFDSISDVYHAEEPINIIMSISCKVPTINGVDTEYQYFSDNYVGINPLMSGQEVTWNFKNSNTSAVKFKSNYDKYSSCIINGEYTVKFHRLLELPTNIDLLGEVKDTTSVLDVAIPLQEIYDMIPATHQSDVANLIGSDLTGKYLSLSDAIALCFETLYDTGEKFKRRVFTNDFIGIGNTIDAATMNEIIPDFWDVVYNLIAGYDIENNHHAAKHIQLMSQTDVEATDNGSYVNVEASYKIVDYPGLGISTQIVNNDPNIGSLNACTAFRTSHWDYDSDENLEGTWIQASDEEPIKVDDVNAQMALPITIKYKANVTDAYNVEISGNNVTPADTVFNLARLINDIYTNPSKYNGLWDDTSKNAVTSWRVDMGVYANKNSIGNGEAPGTTWNKESIYVITQSGGYEYNYTEKSRIKLETGRVYDIVITPYTQADELEELP